MEWEKSAWGSGRSEVVGEQGWGGAMERYEGR